MNDLAGKLISELNFYQKHLRLIYENKYQRDSFLNI